MTEPLGWGESRAVIVELQTRYMYIAEKIHSEPYRPRGCVTANPFLSYSAADAKRVLVVLLGCEVLLVLGYVVTRIVLDGRGGPVAALLDMDRESSVPTWFSSVQLAVISLLLMAQTRLASELRGFLFLLALCFLFLSVDEASAIHEKISETVERQLAWVVPYLSIACAGALLSWRSLLYVWRGMRREACLVAAGLALFLGGGIGVELVTFELQDRAYYLAVAAEEFLEMAGMSVVLYGFALSGLQLQAMSSPLAAPALVAAR